MEQESLIVGLFIGLICITGSAMFVFESANAAVGLKVFVELEHKGVGIAKICVNPLYHASVCELFELPSLSSGSYLGPIETKPGSIEDNQPFKVCVSEATDPSKKENCKQWINGPEKAPEYVSLSMPKVSAPDFDFPKIDLPNIGFLR